MGSKFENFDFSRDCQKVETEYWANDSVLPCLFVNLFKFATACGKNIRLSKGAAYKFATGCDSLAKKKRPLKGASAQRYYRWGG